jgi:hypothetical protein
MTAATWCRGSIGANERVLALTASAALAVVLLMMRVVFHGAYAVAG